MGQTVSIPAGNLPPLQSIVSSTSLQNIAVGDTMSRRHLNRPENLAWASEREHFQLGARSKLRRVALVQVEVLEIVAIDIAGHAHVAICQLQTRL